MQGSIMTDKTTLFLTTLFVTFAAVANLVRLIWDIPICIGPLTFPGWTGGIVYLGFGMLSAWSFRALSSLSGHPPSIPSDL